MGSTNFNVPPLKLTLTVMGSVVVLHLLTAMTLVMVKAPITIIEPLKITPPIEIQLMSAPVPFEEPTVEIAELESLKPSKTQSDVKPKPTVKPKKTIQPVAKKETLKPKIDIQPTTITKVVKSKPVIKQQTKSQEADASAQANALAADNERKMLAVQTEKAAQQAHAEALREAKTAQDTARAKAEAANDRAAEKAAAIASNTPVNFNASNANWASSPNFSFPARAKRGTKSGDVFKVVLVLQVNKQGGIDSVGLAQSSGSAILDREAQQQVRSGKFRPFMKNGIPVVGNVTLPIKYAVP